MAGLDEYIEKATETGDQTPHEVKVIFTDNLHSNAAAIGQQFGVPVLGNSFKTYLKLRGATRKDWDVREEYDKENAALLSSLGIDVLAYAGYMLIATAPLVENFLGINVHPADRGIMENGKRKYTRDRAVRDAILAAEPTLSSSTHIIEPEVDVRRLLMVSDPIPVVLGADFDPRDKKSVAYYEDLNQDSLKEIGDWRIFPRTLEGIAPGPYSQDDSSFLYYKGSPIPHGVRGGTQLLD